ncbi:hypothetical protein TW81_16025 [Vibrio galatheae]|uniref:Transcriptional regulator n=1 Tax=Vibrio galatheae TaxID=579748 RepID=A0A0F4NG64_9VIBR|nr:Rrf2 family transcriptional regulator [Vibrio galatheae]KJY81858.1 hypothetical protein TW81_16025 [Vibrio galatheae]
MRTDSRLSRVIHALLHMQDSKKPLTSDLLAKMLNTNPAVVRRTMAGLRDKGYVLSTKGHNGGWELAVPTDQITLLGLYEALGMPRLFAIAPETEKATCLVQQIADETLMSALERSRATFLSQLEAVSLADLDQQFRQRLAQVKECDRHAPLDTNES